MIDDIDSNLSANVYDLFFIIVKPRCCCYDFSKKYDCSLPKRNYFKSCSNVRKQRLQSPYFVLRQQPC